MKRKKESQQNQARDRNVGKSFIKNHPTHTDIGNKRQNKCDDSE